MEGFIRNVGEEVMRLLQQVMENNAKILELQKQLVTLKKKDTEKRKRKHKREWRRREYNKRWKEEEQKKRREKETK